MANEQSCKGNMISLSDFDLIKLQCYRTTTKKKKQFNKKTRHIRVAELYC